MRERERVAAEVEPVAADERARVERAVAPAEPLRGADHAVGRAHGELELRERVLVERVLEVVVARLADGVHVVVDLVEDGAAGRLQLLDAAQPGHAAGLLDDDDVVVLPLLERRAVALAAADLREGAGAVVDGDPVLAEELGGERGAVPGDRGAAPADEQGAGERRSCGDVREEVGGVVAVGALGEVMALGGQPHRLRALVGPAADGGLVVQRPRGGLVDAVRPASNTRRQ